MELALVLPNHYEEIEQEEMMYLEGGRLTAGQKATIISITIVSGVAIGAAIWIGAWTVAAKIFGLTVKGIINKAGAAAVVGTLIGALGVGNSTAWSITNAIRRL